MNFNMVESEDMPNIAANTPAILGTVISSAAIS
jgi:hypothetical protein